MEHTVNVRVENHRAGNLPGSSCDGRDWILYILTDDKNGSTIARVHGVDENDVTKLAYAIVSACNNHDRLVRQNESLAKTNIQNIETINILLAKNKELSKALKNIVSRSTYSEESMSCFIKAKQAIKNCEG